MPTPILIAENLVTLKEPCSFSVERGALTALIGPNGAGKTTLLRTFLGERKPLAGTCRFDDDGGPRDLFAIPTREMPRCLAYVPQEISVPGHVSVETFARFAFLPKLGLFGAPSADDEARLSELLDHLGLAPLRQRRIASLSTGEKQRASLARAILQRPRCLLLDEPTNHLDPAGSHQFWEALTRERKAEGLTVLVVTHDLTFARERADRTLALTSEGIAFDGETRRFFDENGVKRVFGI